MAKIDDIHDMHMGNFLFKYCGLKWQKEMGSAYVVPPIGNFVAHESTTSRGNFLNDRFSAKWSQEGTSPVKDSDKPRWICGFIEKGPPTYLHDRPLDFSRPWQRSQNL